MTLERFRSLTETQPIVIRTEKDLKAIVNNRHYVLANDITFTSPWKPLPETTCIVLDGQGHTLHNLVIGTLADVRPASSQNGSGASSLGLFTKLNGSYVHDLNFADVTLSGNAGLGTLAFAILDTWVTRVNLDNVTINGLSNLGGLTSVASFSLIETVRVTVKIWALSATAYPAGPIGGLVAFTDRSTISRASTNVDIAVVTYFFGSYIQYGIGGLTGWLNESHVKESVSRGRLDGAEILGGLVGAINRGLSPPSHASTIEDSYAVVDVTANGLWDEFYKKTFGGLVGGVFAQVGAGDDSLVKRTYSIGRVIEQRPASAPSTSAHIVPGGLIGTLHAQPAGGNSTKYLGGLSVEQSFWDTTTTGIAAGEYGTPKSSAALKTAATFSGWDPRVWVIRDGSYPTLKWEP